jgi:hypothetical protein
MKRLDYSSKSVVIFEENYIWSKSLVMWCKHFGFTNIQVFSDKKHYKKFIDQNREVDICIINFFNENGNTEDLIKFTRKLMPNVLIFAVSSQFVNDQEVINTKEMLKAIYAGANRATIKQINYLKHVIDEHLKVRTLYNIEINDDDTRTFTAKI